MGVWAGKIGYAVSEEVADRPGIYMDTIVEKPYKGSYSRVSAKWQKGESANDNLSLSVSISIVADPYAYTHYDSIKYITFNGARWKVISIDPSSPRMTLMLGGVYNGELPSEPSSGTD